ncbi:MAG: 50S ribosomal protein L24 [Hyphomicrobiales bacterium]|nr:50S ribosomal protein L24 [Hyphomicrobiales bacterium]
MRIKKGDHVIVVAGKDKGKTGDVVKVLREENRVIVSGINIVKKHEKPSMASAGGIVQKEASLHVSNVALVDPKTSKPTRVGYKILDNGEKVRIAKRSGEVIG